MFVYTICIKQRFFREWICLITARVRCTGCWFRYNENTRLLASFATETKIKFKIGTLSKRYWNCNQPVQSSSSCCHWKNVVLVAVWRFEIDFSIVGETAKQHFNQIGYFNKIRSISADKLNQGWPAETSIRWFREKQGKLIICLLIIRISKQTT